MKGSLFIVNFNTPCPPKLHDAPEGWERGDGMTVGPDGTRASFAEKNTET